MSVCNIYLVQDTLIWYMMKLENDVYFSLLINASAFATNLSARTNRTELKDSSIKINQNRRSVFQAYKKPLIFSLAQRQKPAQQ